MADISNEIDIIVMRLSHSQSSLFVLLPCGSRRSPVGEGRIIG